MPQDGDRSSEDLPGRPAEVWWFGFDCGHAGDLVPGLEEWRREIHPPAGYRDTYATFDYVKAEVTSLAQQFGALGNRT